MNRLYSWLLPLEPFGFYLEATKEMALRHRGVRFAELKANGGAFTDVERYGL